jgi:hypothetical protein
MGLTQLTICHSARGQFDTHVCEIPRALHRITTAVGTSSPEDPIDLQFLILRIGPYYLFVSGRQLLILGRHLYDFYFTSLISIPCFLVSDTLVRISPWASTPPFCLASNYRSSPVNPISNTGDHQRYCQLGSPGPRES